MPDAPDDCPDPGEPLAADGTGVVDGIEDVTQDPDATEDELA